MTGFDCDSTFDSVTIAKMHDHAIVTDHDCVLADHACDMSDHGMTASVIILPLQVSTTNRNAKAVKWIWTTECWLSGTILLPMVKSITSSKTGQCHLQPISHSPAFTCKHHKISCNDLQ